MVTRYEGRHALPTDEEQQKEQLSDTNIEYSSEKVKHFQTLCFAYFNLGEMIKELTCDE